MFVGLLQAGVLRRRVFTVGVPSINSQTQGNSDVCSIYIYMCFLLGRRPTNCFFGLCLFLHESHAVAALG